MQTIVRGVCIALWSVVLPLAVALPVGAQSAGRQPPDTNAQSIARLIERLPGKLIALDDLLAEAARRNLELRLAENAGREAAARARAEGGVVDPQFVLASERIPDPLGLNGPSRQRSSATVSSALPWGTRFDLSSYRLNSGLAVGTGVPGASAATGYAVSLFQPLLEGFGQETAEWRASTRDAEAAQAQARRSWEEMRASVAVAYWGLGEAQATEAVFQRSQELAEALLARALELAKRDLVAQVDVLTLRSGVAIREAQFNEARQVRRERSDALVLLAFGGEAAVRLAADSLPMKTLDPPLATGNASATGDLLAAALRERRDVQAARLQLEGAAIRLARARNFRRPSLGVTAGYAADHLAGSGGFPESANGNRQGAWRLGLSLAMPLLNRRDAGNANAAALAVEIQSFRVKLVENAVVGDVRTAERRVRMGLERLAITTRAADFAWAQLVAERRRLELGFSDAFRLLQTEENAVRTQLDAVRARYDVLRAQAQLDLALGRVNVDTSGRR